MAEGASSTLARPTAREDASLRIGIIPGTALMHGSSPSSQAAHFHGLARALSKAGHQVDVIDLDAKNRRRATSARVEAFYHDEGMGFMSAPEPSPRPARQSPHGKVVRLPYTAYEFLKNADYDVLHMPDRDGVAYYYLQAKRLGLLARPAYVFVHVQAPYLYRLEIGEAAMKTYADPVVCWLERRSAELADKVVAASPAIRRWMLKSQYEIEDGDFVDDPGLTLPVPPVLSHNATAEVRSPIQNLVFVGRLNQVKGLTTFCYAIRDLISRGRLPAMVKFVGPADPLFDAEAFISDQASRWPFPWELCADVAREQLLIEMARPGTAVVVPSLFNDRSLVIEECLALGVPFLTSDNIELSIDLNAIDRGQFLVAPNHLSIADRLEAWMCDAAPTPTTRCDPSENESAWVRLHRTIPSWQETNGVDRGLIAPTRAVATGAADLEPTVSVCIAHYNRPDLLGLTLDSLMAQTFRDFEIIVVDDGSDSQHRARLDALVSQYNGLLVCQPNLYLGAARNTGARRARGRYLLFMDDDNCAMSHELETLVGIAERVPIDILVSFSDTFTGGGRPEPHTLRGIRRLPIGQDLVYGLFRNGYGDSNCFMRREVWEALGGFTEHYRIGLDDHELFTRATLAGFSIDVVPESLFYYRLADKKMKRFHASQRADFVRVLKPYLDAGAIAPDLVPILFAARGFFEAMHDLTSQSDSSKSDD